MQDIAAHPRISVSVASSLSWTLEEDLAFYKSIGVAAIGVALPKYKNDMQDVARQIQTSGLRLSGLVGTNSSVSMIDGALDKLRPTIDCAATLKCPTVYFVAQVTPPHTPPDQAFAALAKSLQPAATYAQSKGVRIAVEHIARSIVPTLADAVDLAREADIGICVELYNCWVERHLERLFAENAKRFAIVQLSDSKTGELTFRNRMVPGDGDMPLEWLLDRLLNAGYGGFFELEALGPKIEEEGYAESIKRGIGWLSERLTRWGV